MKESEKILLTGATGFIGRELGKALVREGYQVVVLARNPERAGLELPFPCKVYPWSSEDDHFPNDALAGVDAVIHIAGESIFGRWTKARREKIINSRVDGTKKIKAAIDKNTNHAVRAFIATSAVGYYGDRQDEILNENSKPGEGFLSRVCQEWEASIFENSSVKYRKVAIRVGMVLGAKGGALKNLIPLFQKGMGGTLGRGDQWMSWIHIDDLTQLFLFLLSHENLSGVFNGVAPEPVTNKVFTQNLAEAVTKLALFSVPALALKIAMGEMSSLVLYGQRVTEDKIHRLGFHFKYPEFRKAIFQICTYSQDGNEEFFSEQWIPHAPEKVFEFFKDEKNLEKLMPPSLGVQVNGKTTGKFEEGTLVNLKMKVHGISQNWQSQIVEWNPPKRFIDQQTKGPFKKWRHSHSLEMLGDGTHVTDHVVFQLPAGILGAVLGGWKVHQDLTKMFKYRAKKMREFFP